MSDRIVHYSLLSLGIAASVVYAGYALYPSVFGPSLAVATPTPFAVSESGALTLTGGADHFVSLTMNGRRVVTRTDGTFAERMLLAPGTNVFTLEATDKFGVTRRKDVTVVYAPKAPTEVETARIVPLEETMSF
jgi:hypothetical protein